MMIPTLTSEPLRLGQALNRMRERERRRQLRRMFWTTVFIRLGLRSFV